MTTTTTSEPMGCNTGNVQPAVVTQQGLQQLQQYPGTPIFIAVQLPPNTRGNRVESYLSRQSMGLGITLIVIGVLAMIFNGVGIAVSDTMSVIGHGFYTGTLLIITGSFGIAAATRKRKCLIITFMVLAIISAVATASLLSVGIVGGLVNECDSSYYGYGCYGEDSYYRDDYYCRWYTSPCEVAAISMEATLAFLGLVAGILCIWASAICCKAVCCCAKPSAITPMTQYGQSQTFAIVGQQQMMSTPMFGGNQVILAVPSGYAAGTAPYPQTQAQQWIALPHQPLTPGVPYPINGNYAMPTVGAESTPPPEYCTANAIPASVDEVQKERI